MTTHVNDGMGQGQPSASHPVLAHQICSLVIKPSHKSANLWNDSWISLRVLNNLILYVSGIAEEFIAKQLDLEIAVVIIALGECCFWPTQVGSWRWLHTKHTPLLFPEAAWHNHLEGLRFSSVIIWVHIVYDAGSKVVSCPWHKFLGQNRHSAESSMNAPS
jgi:hypothetical protein